METSTDWKADLELLLHFYHSRPHCLTKISPFTAMMGWEPSSRIVECMRNQPERTLSQWVDDLTQRVADVWDHLEQALSSADSGEADSGVHPYTVGDVVMLLRPKRQQKLLSPYEPGWIVRKLLSPSTVVIEHEDHPERQKVINIELLKRYVREQALHVPGDEDVRPTAEPEFLEVNDEPAVALELAPQADSHGYNLRNRAQLRQPERLA